MFRLFAEPERFSNTIRGLGKFPRTGAQEARIGLSYLQACKALNPKPKTALFPANDEERLVWGMELGRLNATTTKRGKNTGLRDYLDPKSK